MCVCRMIFIHSFFFCNLCLYNVYIFIDMELLLMFYVIYKKKIVEHYILNIITKFFTYKESILVSSVCRTRFAKNSGDTNY